MENWSPQKLETERNRFVAARKDHVSWTGLFLIFFCTLLSTWLTSATLLHTTQLRMPLRYVLAIAVGYVIFFLAVRVWADFQKKMPQYKSKGDEPAVVDLPIGSEDFIFAVVLLAPIALILGGLFSWFGAAALLEVAFEVAFAGVMVRSAWQHNKTVGDWQITLLRKTGWMVLIFVIVVYVGSRHIQATFPQVQTAADLIRLWLKL